MSTVQTHPLISMHPTASIQETAQLMNDCSIACVGVLNHDKSFAGIVTERDITAFVSGGQDPTTTLVGEIVNDFPVVMEGPVSDEAAMERMRSAHIRHLLVKIDGEFRILSMRDFLSAPSMRNGHQLAKVASDPTTWSRMIEARPSFDWGPHGHQERSEWPYRQCASTAHH
jgi:signal-transduction protein with cAMP-binding, CBS, and nucleotidyltransferase domain